MIQTFRSLPPLDIRRRAIRQWLLWVAALVFAMVVIGGATRLTESGLSIVEWQPVMGVVPPLTSDQWQAEFDKYKAIPQYAKLNPEMSVGDFKTIYWWEWTHRLVARVIGVVFLLPLLLFLWRGWISQGLKRRLWFIFGLGALQGAVGWWMVASGLADRVDVSQYRLATHLLLACLIFVAVVWTAQGLRRAVMDECPLRIRVVATILLIMVLAQLYLGALVAGLHAGLLYNTWPGIDGAFVPDNARLWFETPAWRNVFENPLTVQFDHRMLAYAIFVIALIHALDVLTSRARGAVAGALLLVGAVTLQAGLGIATLLYQVPLELALLHQSIAMVVLTIAIWHAECVRPRRAVIDQW